MNPPYARELPDGVELSIWAQPRASRTRVVGLYGEQLRVALAAPPVDGEANAELLRFLAKALGVPARQLELVRGDTSRSKAVQVRGMTLPAVTQLLTR